MDALAQAPPFRCNAAGTSRSTHVPQRWRRAGHADGLRRRRTAMAD